MANMASSGKSGPGQWQFLVVGGLAALGERSLGAGWRQLASGSRLSFHHGLPYLSGHFPSVSLWVCLFSSGFSILVYVLEAPPLSLSEGDA